MPIDPADEQQRLYQALTLKALHEIQEDGIERVLCEVHDIRDLILRSTRIEMQQLDAATTAIGEKLVEIAAALPPDKAELVARLKAHAASLNAMGKTSPPPITP